jgi:zinc transporter
MIPSRFEFADTRGLIGGYAFLPPNPPQPIGWTEIGELAPQEGEGFLWLHFNLTDVRACEWIARNGVVPAEAAHFLLGSDSRIRLDPLGDAIVGVLGDLHYDFDLDPEALGLVRFYARPNLVISGRRHALKAVERLRQQVASGASINSPIGLLARLLDHLAATFEGLIHDITDQVDGLEDRILSGRLDVESAEIGRVRRLMARLRRHLNAERHELADILTQLPLWCTESDAADLHRASGRLDSFGQDLELLNERGRLLQEEISDRRAEATNRNLYVLSIVTAIFLPMTLITGLFGINVGGMPWLEDHEGFLIVTLVTVATALLAILILRWRKLF